VALEIANSLTAATRRQRIDDEFRRVALSILQYGDCDGSAHRCECLGQTLHLADQCVYAAAYLELALRRQLPLATLEKELRAVATSFGVKLPEKS
jgi:predicted nucleic acid-binding protein